MKIRQGFVSNSSSSSFIISDKKNIEKTKEIINHTYDDYYEFEGKLYTSLISDGSDIFSEISELSSEDIDGGHTYPYDEENFIEFEGDRGIDSVWIEKKVIATSETMKFFEELKKLDNSQVNDIMEKYKRVLDKNEIKRWFC